MHKSCRFTGHEPTLSPISIHSTHGLGRIPRTLCCTNRITGLIKEFMIHSHMIITTPFDQCSTNDLNAIYGPVSSIYEKSTRPCNLKFIAHKVLPYQKLKAFLSSISHLLESTAKALYILFNSLWPLMLKLLIDDLKIPKTSMVIQNKVYMRNNSKYNITPQKAALPSVSETL